MMENASWLSDFIPTPNFDSYQGGARRKSEEAECAFCCTVVSGILKSDLYTREFRNVYKD